MNNILESLKIDLKGLKEDITSLDFSLDNAYFEAVDGPEVRSGVVHVTLRIRKMSDCFQLDFHTEGAVQVPCDICLDDMTQPIASDNRLMAKFGEEDTEESDDLVVVDETKGILDISWLIYEFIALGIPVKHVHEEGGCNEDMLKALSEHSAGQQSPEAPVDTRWSELEKLKTIIKD